MARARVLTIDIGGTKINASVVSALPKSDGHGLRAAELGPVSTRPTPAREGAAAVLGAALACAREALVEADASSPDPVPICAVSVASAGVINSRTGRVTAATEALPGWAGTDLVGTFREEFGTPATALNDVLAHGLGEATFGVGRGLESLLLVAVGTGIGGALVRGTEAVEGAHGAAGHVGHMPVPGRFGADVDCSCGHTGHLEGFASGPGIAAELTRRGHVANSTRRVAELANGDGDIAASALSVLSDAGLATGRAIGALLNIVDPSAVAVTGGVASATGRAGQAWWGALRDGVSLEAMSVVRDTPVRPAAAGNHAALLGAAALALNSERSQ